MAMLDAHSLSALADLLVLHGLITIMKDPEYRPQCLLAILLKPSIIGGLGAEP